MTSSHSDFSESCWDPGSRENDSGRDNASAAPSVEVVEGNKGGEDEEKEANTSSSPTRSATNANPMPWQPSPAAASKASPEFRRSAGVSRDRMSTPVNASATASAAASSPRPTRYVNMPSSFKKMKAPTNEEVQDPGQRHQRRQQSVFLLQDENGNTFKIQKVSSPLKDGNDSSPDTSSVNQKAQTQLDKVRAVAELSTFLNSSTNSASSNTHGSSSSRQPFDSHQNRYHTVSQHQDTCSSELASSMASVMQKVYQLQELQQQKQAGQQKNFMNPRNEARSQMPVDTASPTFPSGRNSVLRPTPEMGSIARRMTSDAAYPNHMAIDPMVSRSASSGDATTSSSSAQGFADDMNANRPYPWTALHHDDYDDTRTLLRDPRTVARRSGHMAEMHNFHGGGQPRMPQGQCAEGEDIMARASPLHFSRSGEVGIHRFDMGGEEDVPQVVSVETNRHMQQGHFFNQHPRVPPNFADRRLPWSNKRSFPGADAVYHHDYGGVHNQFPQHFPPFPGGDPHQRKRMAHYPLQPNPAFFGHFGHMRLNSAKRPSLKTSPPASTGDHIRAIQQADRLAHTSNGPSAILAASLMRGVTIRPSGKWQAQCYYEGKSRYIGVFDSREKAALAYEVARQKFLEIENEDGDADDKEGTTFKQKKPSTEVIESRVKAARNAAFSAVEGLEPQHPYHR